MQIGSFLQVLILTFSGIAMGGAISMLFLPSPLVLEGRVERMALNASGLGFAIMVALISEVVYNSGPLPTNDWHVYLYAIGALLAGSGYLVLMIRGIIRRRRGEHAGWFH
jgi:hypothetical protein